MGGNVASVKKIEPENKISYSHLSGRFFKRDRLKARAGVKNKPGMRAQAWLYGIEQTVSVPLASSVAKMKNPSSA